MAQQHIDFGTPPTGSDGDTVVTALRKVEDNFTELYGNTADAQLKGGLRNLLINAAGSINQRGYVSGTATAMANQYTIDRWKVKTSGQNVAWTTSGGISTFTTPAGGFAQVVEGVSILGGSYTLSWTGTATATVAGSAVTNGTPFMLPANTNAEVVFSGGTVSKPQLELGEQTAFELRPQALETTLCRRYYEKSYGITTSPGAVTRASCLISYLGGLTSGTFFSGTFAKFAVEKRTTPAITLFSPDVGTAGKATDAAHSNVDVNAGAANIGTNGFLWFATASGAATSVQLLVHYTADAEL